MNRAMEGDVNKLSLLADAIEGEPYSTCEVQPRSGAKYISYLVRSSLYFDINDSKLPAEDKEAISVLHGETTMKKPLALQVKKHDRELSALFPKEALLALCQLR